MNKEDILKEIENDTINERCFPPRKDCCDVENQVFENVILDNIKCYRLTFNNCIFNNVQFLDNQIEWIEFRECKFINSVVKGVIEDALLVMSNNTFENCKIFDFALSGFDEQSEIIDNKFEDCTFSNINIEADLSISGGYVVKSTAKNLNCKMNMIFEMEIFDSKIENINLDVAIMRNSLKAVEINNISLGEECVNKNNVFEDCYMDGKLIEN